jgi:general secretion pathway protein A
MYYKHFGLSGSPFQHTITTADLYRSREHSEALAVLEWGLFHEPTGFTMLLGEPGTGKTTLVGSVIAQQSDRLIVAYLNHPRLEFEELLRLIFRQLNVDPPPSTKLEGLEAMRMIVSHALPDQCVAVIVDEAQDLSPEAFEEFRLLSNFARDGGKLLRIVFVGQPRLLMRLSSPELRQLNERVGARTLLNPMEPAEMYEYIDHRLHALNGNMRAVFSRAALHALVRHSDGIARRANVLCHNSMLAAYSAGARKVRIKDVAAVVTEYQNLMVTARPVSVHKLPPPKPRESLWTVGRPIAALAVLLLLGLGLTSLWIRLRPVIPYQPQNPVASGAYRQTLRVGSNSNLSAIRTATKASPTYKYGDAKLARK